ncbi:MAG: DUF5822 domain-containing protein [Halobacteriaceae archaeon]
MPTVRETNPDGIDFGWVMQMTFLLTILFGVPAIALLSVFVRLPTWTSRAIFAVQTGSAVWFVTAVIVYLYATITQK